MAGASVDIDSGAADRRPSTAAERRSLPMRTWLVVSAIVIGAVLGPTGCASGDGDSTARPSAPASGLGIERPSPDEAERTQSLTTEPTRSRDADPTAQSTRSREAKPTAQPTRSHEPPSTAQPAGTSTRPPTSAAAAPANPARTSTPADVTTRSPTPAAAEPGPAQTTHAGTPDETAAPTASPSTEAAAAVGGTGPVGLIVLVILLAAITIGGLLAYRSQRKSGWDAEARALEAETRTLTGTRLPATLTADPAGRGSVMWSPLRADLIDLVTRWNGLIERAPGDQRRNWSIQIQSLLRDLIAAVDGECEALALGNDWTLLRPRVERAQQALATALAVTPRPEPPAAGEPGPPAFQA